MCSRCLELKDTVVGRTDESGVTLPPLHPRCRCAIMYRELKGEDKKPRIAPLAAPPPSYSTPAPSTAPKIISLPNATGACKTFDELKLYWADNYNVKVAPEISKLDFESVRAAMSGVEAVLEEFPEAKKYLREFDVYSCGLMSTWRGHGKIFFNPEIFSSAEKVMSEIESGVESGFYPKNMTAVGVGAHEAGHIVEDWLRKKYAENTETKLRILPRKLIRKAYQKAILTLEGKGKSIQQMKSEISNHAMKKSLSECLSDAVCDYMTNNVQAALLSREIWEVLKGEIDKMYLFSEMRLAKYKKEEILNYGVFDKMGCLVGVKEDAPPEFKEAYEHDKKMDEEWEALGID